MYTIWDSTTETLVEVFNDYESAQMFLLQMSDLIPDGGINLTIEAISTVQDWAMDNAISLGELV
jgi:hypothetical protein